MAEKKLAGDGFLGNLGGLLKDMRKAAGVTPKRAATQDNPPTDHPSGSEDNGTMDVHTGARYSENSSMVKEDVPNSVDKGPEGVIADGGADANQYDVGITSTTTGNDPANEDPKEDKTPDPGTSHPASSDRNEKYGSLSFKQAHEASLRLGGEIAADIAVKYAGVRQEKAAAKTPPAAPAAKPAATPAPTNKVAALAQQEKAQRERYEGFLTRLTKNAALAADLVAQELFRKAAEEAEKEVEDAAGEQSVADGDADNASAPEGGKDEASMGDVPGGEDALGAMLGGGGGSEPGMGGDPGAGGAGDQTQMLDALAQILAERGIAPEELIQLLGGAGGGGDPGMGGPPPGMGGGDPMGGAGAPPPPGGLDPAAAGMGGDPMGGGVPPVDPSGLPKAAAVLRHKRASMIEAAQNVKAYKKSGRFRFRPVKNAQEYELRNLLHGFLDEVLPR